MARGHSSGCCNHLYRSMSTKVADSTWTHSIGYVSGTTMTMSYQLPWVRTLAMILLLLSQGSGSYENLWHRCCSSESSFCTLDDLSDSLTLSREQSLPHSFRSDVSINMISFSSTDILDYAIYSYIVDAAYAEHRGYTLQLHNKPVYEPRDHRWNRVKLIENLLRSHEVDRAAVEEPVYYVWFDADLIFINFSFAIESVIDQYPHADIIISAERHAETGIANTGPHIYTSEYWLLINLRLKLLSISG